MTPLLAWFADRGWTAFPFQEEAWRRYAAGESGLLHAPTGTGKTLAACGGPMLEALDDPAVRAGSHHPLRLLWITPLRALAGDTEAALAEAAAALGLPWTVERRTGDTTAAVRRRQKRRLPSALVTTPESLSLLLSWAGTTDLLRTVRGVVVDEWHELLGSKRGVQTELCLARLRRLAPGLRTWGLSATLGNVDEALATLVGPAPAAPARLLAGAVPKAIEIETLAPDDVTRFPWAGHLGLVLLPRVLERIDAAASTLVFTNTRSQAEIWFQSILRARPDLVGAVAIHHGSLARDVRERVEQMLREGALRAVVCTSSLDLGVDFTPVDQVIQIGSPKGVARMMQRAGRSGHRPGATSRVLGVPTNALELIEFAAARDAATAGTVESREPVDRPIDVLVQHLVTLALGAGFDATEMLDEIRGTRAFAALGDDEWRWALDFVRRGGETLRAYPQYRRVEARDGRYVAASTQVERLHRMAIGTIPSGSTMTVKVIGGRTLGTIEESFIARLRRGDRFVFGGRTLELVRVLGMTAQVRAATKGKGTVPRWMGGRSPLSTQLAAAVRDKLEAARAGVYEREMALVRPLLELQAAWSRVPARDELLVETSSYRGGHHAFVFTFAGRLVNEGLATLVAWRVSRRAPASLSMTANDHAFELHAREPFAFDEAVWRSLLTTDRLVDDLLACLNDTELARRRFRDIARVAGLVFPGYPGQGKTARQLQASSDLFYDVFLDFDPANLLLDQARREVLERELEVARMRDALGALAAQRITIVPTPRFSPLAFPLWADRIRTQQVSSETWIDRVQRMALQLERAADRESTKRRTRRDRDHVGV